jgi:hypothetical protein
MPIRPLLIAVLAVALLFIQGCSATVGDKATQVADKIDTTNRGPTSVRMVDKERGTLSTDGVGPGRHTYLNEDGVETMSTGVTPRTMIWDGAAKRLVLDSGTDITAKGVELRVNGDGNVGLIKIDEFGTIASEPTRATNEAYDRLAAVWKARDEASKEAILAEIEALKVTAPEVATALLTLLGGL